MLQSMGSQTVRHYCATERQRWMLSFTQVLAPVLSPRGVLPVKFFSLLEVIFLSTPPPFAVSFCSCYYSLRSLC